MLSLIVNIRSRLLTFQAPAYLIGSQMSKGIFSDPFSGLLTVQACQTPGRPGLAHRNVLVSRFPGQLAMCVSGHPAGAVLCSSLGGWTEEAVAFGSLCSALTSVVLCMMAGCSF